MRDRLRSLMATSVTKAPSPVESEQTSIGYCGLLAFSATSVAFMKPSAGRYGTVNAPHIAADPTHTVMTTAVLIPAFMATDGMSADTYWQPAMTSTIAAGSAAVIYLSAGP